jgi:hypothetical protein
VLNGEEVEQDRKDAQKPVCRLVGTDGNVFSIIARVSKTLKEAGLPERADEFTEKAFSAHSYNEVLLACFDYVEIV